MTINEGLRLAVGSFVLMTILLAHFINPHGVLPPLTKFSLLLPTDAR